MRTPSAAEEVRASDSEEAQYRASSTVALSAIRPPAPAEAAPAPPAPPPDFAPAPPQDPGAPQPRDPAPPPAPGATRPAAEPPRRRRKYLVRFAVVAVLFAILGISAWIATRAVFFVGVTDDTRTVAIFRGLPYDLPAGIELYSTHYTSGVTIEQVPAARRGTFTDHKLRSLEDARDLVTQLEEGALQP